MINRVVARRPRTVAARAGDLQLKALVHLFAGVQDHADGLFVLVEDAATALVDGQFRIDQAAVVLEQVGNAIDSDGTISSSQVSARMVSRLAVRCSRL